MAFAVGVMATLQGCDLISSPSTFDLVTPNSEYEIDTWGTNSEVYEFSPKGNHDYVCVMLMLDSGKAMGLNCIPKK